MGELVPQGEDKFFVVWLLLVLLMDFDEVGRAPALPDTGGAIPSPSVRE